jgi:hypothetical protein
MPPRKKATSKPAEPESFQALARAEWQHAAARVQREQKQAEKPASEEPTPDEPKEILTALKIGNFVKVEYKKHGYAFDMVSDPMTVIMYRKNDKGQWVKDHGPYQPTVRVAVAKIREKLIRVAGAGKAVKELDELIGSLDQMISLQLTNEFDRLRKHLRDQGKNVDVPEAPMGAISGEMVQKSLEVAEQVKPRLGRKPAQVQVIELNTPEKVNEHVGEMLKAKAKQPEAMTSEELFARKQAEAKARPGRKKRGS